ncbi:MAG: DUF4435 domain-containing protein [Rikenellaceae bacterium]
MKRTLLHRLKGRYGNNRSLKRRVELPQALPVDDQQRLIHIYVEGYEDVAFWRGIFDHFVNPYMRFEISVPTRRDLPKGKKILLGMIPHSSPDLLLCVDSDFDHLFHNSTEQSRQLNSAEFMFHTYTYATENYLCYAPSLHKVCVKATKNDTCIFDFEEFMEGYSRAIYPAFLWYAYSAQLSSEGVFLLSDFRATVRLGYVDLEDSGLKSVEWVARNVERRVAHLTNQHPEMRDQLEEFRMVVERRGVTADNCYLYMHGHTLMDSVVLVVLNGVCEKLRQLALARIIDSSKEGTALKNEISNYNNTQRSIKDVLLDNENYIYCPLYELLHDDISRYMTRCLWDMKDRGEITAQQVEAVIKEW